MPMFNFKKQFADAVEAGDKRQTIRAKRKNRPQVDQTAYLYTGTRTKACRKLGEYPIYEVCPILIGGNGIIFYYDTPGEFSQTDLYCLNIEAQLDGFKDWPEMRDWFEKTHGLPFEGDLIKW